MSNFIDYIPIATTLFSIYFFIEIYKHKHYQIRKMPYLFWWTIGVLTFGLGTLAESIHALFGWHIINLKYWYIVGALLGGFPLAQGSVYLLTSRRFANITSWIYCTLIVITSIAVIATPLTIPDHFEYKLTGTVFNGNGYVISLLSLIFTLLSSLSGALYTLQ